MGCRCLEGLQLHSHVEPEKAPPLHDETLGFDQHELHHHIHHPARPPGGVLHPAHGDQLLGGGEAPGGDGGVAPYSEGLCEAWIQQDSTMHSDASHFLRWS